MLISDGGDDRIRTCEGLLTLNGLANRRLQPLGHISAAVSRGYSKLRVSKVKARIGTERRALDQRS